MNEAIDIGKNFELKYLATDLLVFYSSQTGEQRVQVYVEHHEIKNGEVLAGKPAPRKTIEQLAIAAEKDTPSTATIRNIVPESLLFHDSRPGKHIVAWYEPAKVRILQFAPKQGYKANYKIPLPPLFFSGNGNELSVWAMKVTGRPTLNTLLFHAPLCNVYDDGKICMGNIESPGEDDVADLVAAWSFKFWNGLFTAHGTDNKKLYAKISGSKVFPPKELKACKDYKNINDVLESL